MAKVFSFIGLAAALALIAVALGGQPPAAEVRCREVAFSQALERRDGAAFAAFIDADARFVGNEVLHGPDEIMAAWEGFFRNDGPGLKWRPRFVEVLASGRLALTRGPYRLSVHREDGTLTESWGTFNSVWRRADDGEWRIVFDAGGPATETPDDDARRLLDALPPECG